MHRNHKVLMGKRRPLKAALAILLLALGVGTSGAPTPARADTAPLDRPSFTAVGSMTLARYQSTATLLGNGKVLFAGGSASSTTAEVFDPASGTFASLAPNNMTSLRYGHTATLLPDARVLIAGGFVPGIGATSTAELFDPASGSFASLPPMTSARMGHTATLLRDGRVLIAGGSTESIITNTAELFDPASGTFTSLSPSIMTSTRYGHTATLLPSGMVLIAGGTMGGRPVSTAKSRAGPHRSSRMGYSRVPRTSPSSLLDSL